MTDRELVRFLQTNLPALGLRWAGFRKVRKTVRKRIARRLRELGLSGLDAYERYISAEPAEAQVLDALCRIPISRFFRDREVFRQLECRVLPACGRDAMNAGRDIVRCLSAGCASGEEPYSVNLVWLLRVAHRFPAVALSILAVDSEPEMLRRAGGCCYTAGSLKDVPDTIRLEAFDEVAGEYRLRDEFRSGIRFQECDIRESIPDGPFDVILCRNLAFTYFSDPVQQAVLLEFHCRLRAGGYLIIGSHEHLPHGVGDLIAVGQQPHVPIYQKSHAELLAPDLERAAD